MRLVIAERIGLFGRPYPGNYGMPFSHPINCECTHHRLNLQKKLLKIVNHGHRHLVTGERSSGLKNISCD